MLEAKGVNPDSPELIEQKRKLAAQKAASAGYVN